MEINDNERDGTGTDGKKMDQMDSKKDYGVGDAYETAMSKLESEPDFEQAKIQGAGDEARPFCGKFQADGFGDGEDVGLSVNAKNIVRQRQCKYKMEKNLEIETTFVGEKRDDIPESNGKEISAAVECLIGVIVNLLWGLLLAILLRICNQCNCSNVPSIHFFPTFFGAFNECLIFLIKTGMKETRSITGEQNPLGEAQSQGGVGTARAKDKKTGQAAWFPKVRVCVYFARYYMMMVKLFLILFYPSSSSSVKVGRIALAGISVQIIVALIRKFKA